MEKLNFGPNVIYFVLGMTESCPAGASWVDKIRRPFVRFRSPLGEGLPSPPHPPSALGPSFSAPLLLTNPSEGYASF